MWQTDRKQGAEAAGLYIHKTTMAVFRLHIVPFTVQALYEHWLNFPPSLLPYHVNTRRASAMWFQSFEVCELRQLVFRCVN